MPRPWQWTLPCLAVALLLVLWRSPDAMRPRGERAVPSDTEPPNDNHAQRDHALTQASAPEEAPRRTSPKPAPFRGTVRFRDGAPAVGLAVSWSPKGPFAVTDVAGRFTWDEAHRGRQQVFLDAGRGGFFRLGFVDVAPGGSGVIEIDRGFPVGGTVRAARDGTPLPGAEVTMRRMGGHGVSFQARDCHATTDDAARFSFPWVPEGSYSLLIRAKGYEPLLRTIELMQPMGDQDWLLGDARELVVHIIAEGEGWAERTFFVQVERWQDRGYFEETRIAPDQRDEARIPAPAPGWYRAHLSFVDQKLLRDTGAREDLVVDSGTTPILTFRVPSGGAVTGTIVLPGGRPLQSRPAQLQGPGFSTNLKTDEKGAFRIPFVPNGRHQIRVFSGTGFRYGKPFYVTGGAEVTVRIDGAGEITGRVEPEPKGAFDNPVEITRASETVAVVYHRDGAFRAEWLEPGGYSVRVAGETAIDVELGDGESRDLGDLHAPARVLLPVQVGVPAGATVPDLVVFTGDGIEEGSVPLDPKGRGQFYWAAGRRSAIVHARGFRDVPIETLVEPDPRTPLRITLERH